MGKKKRGGEGASCSGQARRPKKKGGGFCSGPKKKAGRVWAKQEPPPTALSALPGDNAKENGSYY